MTKIDPTFPKKLVVTSKKLPLLPLSDTSRSNTSLPPRQYPSRRSSLSLPAIPEKKPLHAPLTSIENTPHVFTHTARHRKHRSQPSSSHHSFQFLPAHPVHPASRRSSFPSRSSSSLPSSRPSSSRSSSLNPSSLKPLTLSFCPPPSQDDLKKSILIIQTAVRGFLARQSYKKMRTDFLFNFIQLHVPLLLKTIKSMESRLTHQFVNGIIIPQDFNDGLSKLTDITHSFKTFFPSIDYLSDRFSRSSIRYLSMLKRNLLEIHYQLETLSHSTGFDTIIDGLNLVLPNWMSQLTPSARHRLDFFNDIFSPNGFCFAKRCHEYGSTYTLHTSKKQTSISSFDLHNGFPYLSTLSLLSPDTPTVLDTIHGAELYIPFSSDRSSLSSDFSSGRSSGRSSGLPSKETPPELLTIVFSGYIKNDALNLSQFYLPFKHPHNLFISSSFSPPTIPQPFKTDFLDTYNLRDYLMDSPQDFNQKLSLSYATFRSLISMPLPSLVKLFARQSLCEQTETLRLLFMDTSSIRGGFLFDLMSKIIPEFNHIIRQCLHFTVQKKITAQKNHFIQMKKRLSGISEDDVPLDLQIMSSNMAEPVKSKALSKSKQLDRPTSESSKIKNWLRSLLTIPFGHYISSPVSITDPPLKIKTYLDSVKQHLDTAVHGHQESKDTFIRIMGQWISNKDSEGMVIGLQGPPGNGKTTFAREGVAKALNRPFAFLSLGGMTDSSYLIGHDFTYIGSNCGQIVDCLIRTKCMNPVILFDELDKVSMTAHGREIIGILTHLTDSSQNQSFQDKYFSGINFDLSKALIIFTFNDANKIDPILRDRISMIHTKALSLNDKIVISHDHLLPKILESLGFNPGDIVIGNSDIEFLISTFTMEAGARRLKDLLFTICRDINLKRLLTPSFKLPVVITRDVILDILSKKHKIEHKSIGPHPLVGIVNGLFATASGSGGLILIESFKTPSATRLSLELTGSQGNVMKQSMKIAKTVAWNLLPTDLQTTIFEASPFGLHINVPETSTPKDGPSAGTAIVVSIISQLTGIPARQHVAMTGEIDLNGNVTKIGGLVYKLQGAKRAGVQTVLIPKDNEPDLKKILEDYPHLLDDDFTIIPVTHILECLHHSLVDHDISFNTPQTFE